MTVFTKYWGVVILCIMVAIVPVRASAPLVNMNAVDTDVRDVLTALADIGDVNIVYDDSNAGEKQAKSRKITVKLKDVPFDTALEMVTKAQGLVYQRIGDVIVVGPPSVVSRNFGSLQIIKLKYIAAENVLSIVTYILSSEMKEDSHTAANQAAKTTQEDKNRDLTSLVASSDFSQIQRSAKGGNGRVQFDGATNAIIFFATSDEAMRVNRMLEELDIPQQQVSLEAEVVELSSIAARELGINWVWDATPTPPVGGKGYGGTIKYGKSPDGTPYQFNYQATVKALVTDEKAKYLAKPNVLAINGKTAKIFIGDSVPVQTAVIEDGKTTPKVEYKDAGIILHYLPYIHSDGQITAKVYTGVSYPLKDEKTGAYTISTRQAETEVRMKDGATMVIGGLINNSESKGGSKIPILGDLPALGKLFQSSSRKQDDSEVVIFLTARIIQ